LREGDRSSRDSSNLIEDETRACQTFSPHEVAKAMDYMLKPIDVFTRLTREHIGEPSFGIDERWF
jgi:hypothetical protein